MGNKEFWILKENISDNQMDERPEPEHINLFEHVISFESYQALQAELEEMKSQAYEDAERADKAEKQIEILRRGLEVIKHGKVITIDDAKFAGFKPEDVANETLAEADEVNSK